MTQQNKENEFTLSKSMIEMLSGAGPSKISRYISHNKIKHLNLEQSRNKRYSISTARNIIKNCTDFSEKKIIDRYHEFHNFKGGTGKTSICYQVATHIALMGFKVLAIDLDPQGHLSSTMGMPDYNDLPTLYDAIEGTHDIDKIKINIFEGLDCIPSNYSLTRIEHLLGNMPKREEIIAFKFKENFDKYDFVFIDTNPSISLLNRNILTLADVVHIVTEPAPLSIKSVVLLLDDIKKFLDAMRIDTKRINIIPNKYEDRFTTAMEGMTALKENFGDLMKENFAIRKIEDINRSTKDKLPLAAFVKKNSVAIHDIFELVNYIIQISQRG